MKLMTVLGARPQFIKAAPVSAAIQSNHIQEIILHTGQHYDHNMSNVFFEQLDIPAPHYNLGINETQHGAMTGRMLAGIEQILIDERPDAVLVYGDTNSTLAGALAAAKLNIPVAHVEAGLRSFNRAMPEEINRVLTDHVASLLFAPTATAVQNLVTEGITTGVHQTGDVMYDAALRFAQISQNTSTIREQLNLVSCGYYLATVHRAENTDDPDRLASILKALAELNREIPVVLPLHPRTAQAIDKLGMTPHVQTLITTRPLPFLDMIELEKSARVIITDSGGIQKEAYFHSVPCVTVRDETEWIETVAAGWNTLTGADTRRIVAAALQAEKGRPIEAYGNGNAAQKISDLLISSGPPDTLPPLAAQET